MNYKDIQENLERYYKTVQSSSNFGDFIKSVVDYVNYILSDDNLKNEISNLQKESKKSYSKYQKAHNELEDKAINFLNSLKSILSSNSIVDASLEDIFRNIENLKTGKMSVSQTHASYYLSCIYEILNYLKNGGEDNCVTELAHLENYNWKLSIDEYIRCYSLEERRYEIEIKNEIWGCWDFISIVPLCVSFIDTNDNLDFGKGLDTDSRQMIHFYVDLYHSIKSHNTEKTKEIESSIKSNIGRINTFLLRRIDEVTNAKIWTGRGIHNLFFKKDVSNIITPILSDLLKLGLGFIAGLILGLFVK